MIKIEYRDKLTVAQSKFVNIEFEKYANVNDLKTNYNAFNFLAYENDELAGILEGVALYDEIRVNNLIVGEKYRNKKIGTKLLDFVLEYFDSKNGNIFHYVLMNFKRQNFTKNVDLSLNT